MSAFAILCLARLSVRLTVERLTPYIRAISLTLSLPEYLKRRYCRCFSVNPPPSISRSILDLEESAFRDSFSEIKQSIRLTSIRVALLISIHPTPSP